MMHNKNNKGHLIAYYGRLLGKKSNKDSDMFNWYDEDFWRSFEFIIEAPDMTLETVKNNNILSQLTWKNVPTCHRSSGVVYCFPIDMRFDTEPLGSQSQRHDNSQQDKWYDDRLGIEKELATMMMGGSLINDRKIIVTTQAEVDLLKLFPSFKDKEQKFDKYSLKKYLDMPRSFVASHKVAYRETVIVSLSPRPKTSNEMTTSTNGTEEGKNSNNKEQCKGEKKSQPPLSPPQPQSSIPIPNVIKQLPLSNPNKKEKPKGGKMMNNENNKGQLIAYYQSPLNDMNDYKSNKHKISDRSNPDYWRQFEFIIKAPNMTLKTVKNNSILSQLIWKNDRAGVVYCFPVEVRLAEKQLGCQSDDDSQQNKEIHDEIDVSKNLAGMLSVPLINDPRIIVTTQAEVDLLKLFPSFKYKEEKSDKYGSKSYLKMPKSFIHFHRETVIVSLSPGPETSNEITTSIKSNQEVKNNNNNNKGQCKEEKQSQPPLSPPKPQSSGTTPNVIKQLSSLGKKENPIHDTIVDKENHKKLVENRKVIDNYRKQLVENKKIIDDCQHNISKIKCDINEVKSKLALEKDLEKEKKKMLQDLEQEKKKVLQEFGLKSIDKGVKPISIEDSMLELKIETKNDLDKCAKGIVNSYIKQFQRSSEDITKYKNNKRRMSEEIKVVKKKLERVNSLAEMFKEKKTQVSGKENDDNKGVSFEGHKFQKN